MKVKRLPARQQKAELIKPVGNVLPVGLIGKIMPNLNRSLTKDTDAIPDYIFRPDANPELAFMVFSSELRIIDGTAF